MTEDGWLFLCPLPDPPAVLPAVFPAVLPDVFPPVLPCCVSDVGFVFIYGLRVLVYEVVDPEVVVPPVEPLVDPELTLLVELNVQV